MAFTGQTLRLEQQLRRKLAAINDDQVRTLVKAWATAWDEVAADLEAALVSALGADGNVSAAQLLRNRHLTSALSVIADKLEALAQQAGITVTGDLRKVIDDAGAAQAGLIASQLPAKQRLVDLDAWARVDARQIDAIVRRATQSITSSTKPLAPAADRAVRRELIRGLASGSNPRQTARRMVERAHGAFNGGLTRALTIARTESLDAHREGARIGQAPHADVLAGWEWVASIGPRTCSACWGMHGTVHSLSEPGPHGHQNCRCARVPVAKSWADLGFDGVEEPPSAMVDADAAFEKLTPFQQQSVLGPAGYRAWRAGKFPRSQWATRRKNPGWRDSYVPARPPKVAKSKGAPTSAPRPPAVTTTPTAPTTARSTAAGPPPMGRTLGTQRQQAHTKSSLLPQAPQTRRDSADYWHTYVPDPEDRTTALLQYVKVFEDLVKNRARSLEAGDGFTAAEEQGMRTIVRQMRNMPETGVGPDNYTFDDLAADITGAAYRLLARRAHEEAVGTVYKGLNLGPAYDLTTAEGLKAAVDEIVTDDWWFTSATPNHRLAYNYLDGSMGDTQVLLIVRDARGIVLDTMGRMAGAEEVLLSGGIDIENYDVVDGVVRIYGRWRR